MKLRSSPLRVTTIRGSNLTVVFPSKVTPFSDISTGDWISSLGGALVNAVNEETQNDTNYISTTTSTPAQLTFAESAYPVQTTTVKYAANSDSSSTLNIRLYQGATTIATRSHSLTSTITVYTQTLTTEEKALIVSGPINIELIAV